ncbi:M16 family metallopeptidase [Streptomyces goshikiensis]|uniref:M16 family metallopeptidase n=1 Tax=Streptomyces goshikiensis TaxID=1942 RepID=UPI00167B3FEE|nr:insulinase family protein [Streptomyces goshikiensis]
MEISGYTPLRTELTGSTPHARALLTLLADYLPGAGTEEVADGTEQDEERSLELLAAYRGAQADITVYGTGLLWSLSLTAAEWQDFLGRAADLLATAGDSTSGLTAVREAAEARENVALLDHHYVASAHIRDLLGFGHPSPASKDSRPGPGPAELRAAEALLTSRRALSCLDLEAAHFTAVAGIDADELGQGLAVFMTSLRTAAADARTTAPLPVWPPQAGSKPPSPAVVDAPTSPATERDRSRTLTAGGGDTACLRVAWPALRRDHPDYPAFFVAQHALGGGYRSRLMRIFRNEAGWSYSPWSVIRHEPGFSYVELNIEVPVEHCEAAETALLTAVAGLSRESLPEDELRRVIGMAQGTAAAALAPQRGLAATLTHIRALDLSPDWLWQWPETLARVQPEDVLEAARRHLRVQEALSVTVRPTRTPAPAYRTSSPAQGASA